MKAALLVATYNGEKVIEKCVRSLLETDYDDKEVIVINDGSDDETLKVLSGFGNSIRILHNDRGGVGSSRNVGIHATTADLVATTDDDCVVKPDWIKESAKYFEDPRVAAVTGEKIYRITNVLSAVRSMEYHVRFLHRGKDAKSVECPVVVFRRDAILNVNGFTVRSKVGGEDTDIGYKLKNAGYRIIYEPRMIVYHDSEDELCLYLRRNFRNGAAYVHVFFSARKKIALSDDFFPILLIIQPFLTLIFILLLLTPSCPVKLPAIGIVAAAMFASFVPVIKSVVGIKGWSSIPRSFVYLSLRNIVWVAGLLVGLKRLVTDGTK